MSWQDDDVVSDKTARWAADPVVSPAPQEPQYNPTDGMSPFDKAAAGVGKAVVDTGRGITQLGAEAGNKVGLVSDATAQGMRANQDQVNQRDSALMHTGAGLAGNIAGNVGMALLPAGVLGEAAGAANLGRTAGALRAFANPMTYRAAAASGAIQGAIRPVGTDESRLTNTAAGGALGVAGNAVANAAGRIAQPFRNALRPDEQAAIDTLRNAGVPLDAAQQTGNQTLLRVRSALKDSPATVGAAHAAVQQQQTAFSRAALRSIGEDAEAATPDVMQRAAERIGSYFDAVAEPVPLRIDERLGNDVGRVMQGARDTLLPEEYGVLDRLMGVVQQRGAYGELNGQQYQRIKQALDSISGQGGTLGHTARDLRASLDAGLQRSAAGTADYQLLQDARRQWRALKQIEPAVAKDGSGAINPSILANTLAQKANRWQSLYGRGDQQLVQLAQAGKRVLTDKLPNSGTAARVAAQFAPAAIVGAGADLATGDHRKAAELAAAMYLLPRGGQALLNNPTSASFLANGLPNGLARNLLEGVQANALTKQLPASAGFSLNRKQ